MKKSRLGKSQTAFFSDNCEVSASLAQAPFNKYWQLGW